MSAPELDPNGELRGIAGDCVHCGFCLPACPTYQLWGEEMDSPRGRIYLMKQVLDGEPLDATVMGHFDNCLGCMSCVTSCPSGVQYDVLIQSTRAKVEDVAQRGPLDHQRRQVRVLALVNLPPTASAEPERYCWQVTQLSWTGIHPL